MQNVDESESKGSVVVVPEKNPQCELEEAISSIESFLSCHNEIPNSAATVPVVQSESADTSSYKPEIDPPVKSSSIWNIFLLGTAFMFSIGALQTCAMVQTVILNSVHDEYFNGTPTLGYICLAVSSSIQAATYLFGPIFVAKTGPKFAIVFGAVCLSLYIACFIRPLTATIYIGSAIMGAGAGTIWLLQGYFVTINSTPGTIGRNTGLFWTLYQASLIFGSLFYYFILHGQNTIDDRTRLIVIYTLLAASVAGILIFCLLTHPWFGSQHPPSNSLDMILPSEPNESARKVLTSIMKIAVRREMLVLLPMFAYIGMEFAFWVNVYPTCLGYTKGFGILRESLVGLNGVFIGIGEIAGGIILGLLGHWSHKQGRDPGLLFATIIHLICFYLILLNLPANSPLGFTDDNSFFKPNEYLAMGCAFLLGLGDAVWNNQLMSFLGIVFPHQTVIAFAVYQFWGSIGGTVALLYSTVVMLPYQLLALAFVSLPGAFGFFYEEWKYSSLTAAQKPKI